MFVLFYKINSTPLLPVIQKSETSTEANIVIPSNIVGRSFLGHPVCTNQKLEGIFIFPTKLQTIYLK